MYGVDNIFFFFVNKFVYLNTNKKTNYQPAAHTLRLLKTHSNKKVLQTMRERNNDFFYATWASTGGGIQGIQDM